MDELEKLLRELKNRIEGCYGFFIQEKMNKENLNDLQVKISTLEMLVAQTKIKIITLKNTEEYNVE